MLITRGDGQLGRALAIAAAGVLIAAACGGGDDDYAGSTISRNQIEAWADELWEKALPAFSDSLAEGCPEDPPQTPRLSIALDGSVSIELAGQVRYESQGTTLPDIPESAQPAVGELLAEKIYAFCGSQAR